VHFLYVFSNQIKKMVDELETGFMK